MVMEKAPPPRESRRMRSPPPISKRSPSFSPSPPPRRSRARSRSPPRRAPPRDDDSMDSRSSGSGYTSSSSRSRSPPRRRLHRGGTSPPPRRRRRDSSLSSASYSSYSSRSRSPPRRRSSRSRGRPRSITPPRPRDRREYRERYSPPRRYRLISPPPRRRRHAPRDEHARREHGRESVEIGRDRIPQVDDRARDLRTVFISQLAQRVREPDVYELFSKAGRVRDVRLIMDRMSSKHKGAGYVEFYDEESVAKAVAFDGTMLNAFPIAVKPTAEQGGPVGMRAVESATMRASPSTQGDVPAPQTFPVKALDDSVVGWSNKYRARNPDPDPARSRMGTSAPPRGQGGAPFPSSIRAQQLVSIEELKMLLNPLGLPPPPPPLSVSAPSTNFGKLEASPRSVEQVPLPTAGNASAPVQPVTVSGAFTRLYVGSIAFQLTEADLRAIFEPFGAIGSLQLQRDANGSSRGYGFVEFMAHESAKKALEINGLSVAGRTLKVALASQEHRVVTPSSVPDVGSTGVVPLPGPIGQLGAGALPGGDVAGELDEGKDSGLAINASQRIALMQQLSRGESIGKTNIDAGKLPVSTEASRNLMLANLFDPATEKKGFEMELAEDVRDECVSKYGPVIHLFVETKSQGVVFVRFQVKEGAAQARIALNGRWFGGRRIQAAFVSDKDYSKRFPSVADK